MTWLNRWLIDVENGAVPTTWPMPYPPVGLIDHDGVLAIISWHDGGRCD